MAGEGGPDQDRVRGRRGTADRARRELLEAWRQASGTPTEGWLFPNPSGTRPLDMCAYANRTIRAMLKEKYKGLYAARRGMATALMGLTGNAAQRAGDAAAREHGDDTWRSTRRTRR